MTIQVKLVFQIPKRLELLLKSVRPEVQGSFTSALIMFLMELIRRRERKLIRLTPSVFTGKPNSTEKWLFFRQCQNPS